MNWEDILGHNRARDWLRHAAAAGRLAHAYLLTGPRGIGKATFAKMAAKTILCRQFERTPEVFSPCNNCDSCRYFDAGTHPDFFHVSRPEGGLELPVESIRDLCSRFLLKPVVAGGKVAIIDDADDLNEESANCFLKTLEEPPPFSVFFLIGTSPERQLPTIRSRCQIIRLAPLPDEDVKTLLNRAGVEDAERIASLLRLAQGSIGKALEFIDPGVWEFQQRLARCLVADRIDPIEWSEMWMRFVESAGSDATSQRRRAVLLLEILTNTFRAALSACQRLDCGGEGNRTADILCERLGEERLIELIERCLRAEGQIRRYVPVSLVLEGIIDAYCGHALARR